ncbi:DUF1345 domain-containing protein [Paenibacillus cremeus]|uniref:DUF1345 domain-containing protein n=2 Tax=Paenibacillus cremeus TaxID=2163881 RepID=A0A559K6B2_9BACL|nr:DUF1345 domain-containing protein [Paenibacillus cremeus]
MAIGLLLSIVLDSLTGGPNWILPLLAVALLIPFSIAVLREHHEWTRLIAIVIAVVVTVGLIASVIFLINALFTHAAEGQELFRDAALLWVINVAVFAVWYWEIDQGGPQLRSHRESRSTDFLFPQMTSDAEQWRGWKPEFLDYLFLAFNTSTAFSPTDTLVMSRRAKLLMMTQASISLVVIAVIAARAVNIA